MKSFPLLVTLWVEELSVPKLLTQYDISKSGWLEWIVIANLPFKFVEHPLTRKNSNLDSITDETIKKYLVLVTENVEKRIAEDLPDKFGIIIDGWKDETTHYIAIFASYSDANGEGQYPLLSIAPPYDEQSFTAETHKAFIVDVLKLFGKGLSSLVYLVGDNEPVNTCLSDLLEVPFIGCASHRFNLACKKYLEEYEEHISFNGYAQKCQASREATNEN